MTSKAILTLVLAGVSLFGLRAQAGSAEGAPGIVTYPASGAPDDKRGDYYVSLLELALNKAGTGLVARPSTNPSVAARAFINMAKGRGIDVVWAPTTTELERDYLPVRIPLDKGILGWRIFLIAGGDQARFASIQSVQELKALTVGQVREWVDTGILSADGFSVVAASRYENLFTMLAARRFDYLPRGVGEVYDEAHNYGHLGLVVESHLALNYPMCTYFFVAPKNVELARHIEKGLLRAQIDGSLEELFQRFFGKMLRDARLDSRLVFNLERPTAPSTCKRAGMPG
ncbi:transporter substrate-binding domain-containing protein [Roseateles saccharophilus]|uniref:ABC-type amino acid transport substrate-binding protein n=1 Tax=Roseateles saccharophilus TaxID=304 RepID=A0A4R3UIH8_ROSSA|nr:transporter substrate-binding domain-containing protein [Roseateles saccharophilus]MDG0834819.1 transporter substrate-binding domain-containing protein [Roseateles saccharophilus]TCU88942.1 ABC-type amino acid transport substrate-binding protein [Roseateles saccharophilus]